MIKIFYYIAGIYFLIGIIFALHYYFSYDPHVTSYPNNLSAFILNIISWPVGLFR